MYKKAGILAKTMALLLYAVLTVTFFGACRTSPQTSFISDEFFAMDTFVTIKANTSDKTLLEEAEQEIRSIESIFSVTESAGELSQINSSCSAQVSPLCAEILTRVLEISEATDGAFNPCMGQLRELWDVTGKQHIPTQDELDAILPFCRADAFTVDALTVTKEYPQPLLDLGAAVKGYAAEQAISLLRRKGVSDAMISLGGNIAVCGSADANGDGWQIGVRNPFFPDTVAGSFRCTDTVIAVSGDYERYFERDGIRYHHIFDPNTGFPADSGLKSTAVISSDGLLADALSTALFVMGKEKALSFYQSGLYDFEAILFTTDGKVVLTDGLRDKFTLFENAAFTENVPLVIER